MLRKFAVALVATTMLMAPALAADAVKTTPAPAATSAKAAVTTPAVKTIKAVKNVKVARHHGRHFRHHRYHRHHFVAKTSKPFVMDKPFVWNTMPAKDMKTVRTVKPHKQMRHVAKVKKTVVKKNSAIDAKVTPKS